MTIKTSRSALEKCLRNQGEIWTTRKIDYGTQYRLKSGAIINHYHTGSVLFQGDREASRKVELALGYKSTQKSNNKKKKTFKNTSTQTVQISPQIQKESWTQSVTHSEEIFDYDTPPWD